MKRILPIAAVLGIVTVAAMSGGATAESEDKGTDKSKRASCAETCAADKSDRATAAKRIDKTAPKTGFVAAAKARAANKTKAKSALASAARSCATKGTAETASATSGAGCSDHASSAAADAQSDASCATKTVTATATTVADGPSCSASSKTTVALAPGPALTGNFETAMSAGCQGACAVSEFTAEDVHHQPGATAGDLTQCPVSGVVFTVRENNPGYEHEGTDFYTCCGACAGILKASPKRFLKS